MMVPQASDVQVPDYTSSQPNDERIPGIAATVPAEPATCPLGWACAAAGALDGEAGRLHHLLRSQPDAPGLHTDLGILLTRRGRLTAALPHLRRAAELTPDAAGVHNNLGIALARQGDWQGAVAQYQQALRLDPDATCTLYNLANALHQLGRLDEAATHYEHIVRLKPADADTRFRLGCLRLEQDRPADALKHLGEANRLKPGSVETLNQLGVVLTRLGRVGEGVARLREAVQIRPDCPISHNNLGIALAKERQFDVAVRHYHESLRLCPNAPGTHANLGNVLRDQGRLEAAVEEYQHSLRLKPDAPDTHNNLGIAYVKLRQMDLALAHYGEALRLKPGFPEAHLNRAHAWLLQGNFREGWPEYEWRWRIPGAEAFRGSQPLWDGSPLEGRTILLHWEQGLGDTLQFVRYAPLVKAKGGRVVFQCQAPLLRLLSRCRGIDRLLPVGAPLPAFDVHAPLQSLPGLLGTTVDTIPAEVPYLFPEPALVERWRQDLAAEPWFKVGIAWQGNPKYGGDLHRSVPLAHLLPLAGVPGVQLYSLQKGLGSEQLRTAAARACVADLASRLDAGPGAFLDTAAVMKNLDLVITSDTAMAHLAGGLGVPVWVALNTGSCWRFLLDRADCPWYPTMRLCRQSRRGDWGSVFERMAVALAELVAQPAPAAG